MTSGNRADEPVAYDDQDAHARLAPIADVFLTHDRPIQVRCDDSVTRIVAGREAPIRRSRGHAPEPMSLPTACKMPILAVGGQLKGTFALGREQHAFISHHLGDIDHFEAYQAFVRDVGLYEKLFDVRPRLFVHDLQPDYASTHYALARAEIEGVALLPVQHHHAHMASCMAEHGLAGPAIGVSFDGSGCGMDGAVWGGEFLVGDYRHFRRAAHFRYVGMPGGDQAVREPWRMALAHLVDASACDSCLAARIPASHRRTARQMLEKQLNTPMTSSVGRLFDAVAAMAGVRDRVRFKGQAAMELEWAAADRIADEGYGWEFEEKQDRIFVDTRPLIRAAAADVRRSVSTAIIAQRFHATLVEIITAICHRIRTTTGLHDVVLSGGVFLNALLTTSTMQRLEAAGFNAYRHTKVPTNDGGLCLGQLAIAAASL